MKKIMFFVLCVVVIVVIFLVIVKKDKPEVVDPSIIDAVSAEPTIEAPVVAE